MIPLAPSRAASIFKRSTTLSVLRCPPALNMLLLEALSTATSSNCCGACEEIVTCDGAIGGRAVPTNTWEDGAQAAISARAAPVQAILTRPLERVSRMGKFPQESLQRVSGA